MEKRKELKIFPPIFMVERVIGQIENIIDIPIKENPLITIYEEKLTSAGIDAKTIKHLKEKAEKIITEKVLPSYQLLLMHLHEIKPKANINHGVWSLPDGENYYSLRLRIMTTSNYSADEIHNIGLSEVERITNEIIDILETEGYENIDNVGQVLPNKILRVNNEDVIEDLEGQVKRMLEFLELPFEEECISFYETDRSVRTASSEQVRRPINRDGMERWKPYSKHLKPLVNHLGQELLKPEDLSFIK